MDNAEIVHSVSSVLRETPKCAYIYCDIWFSTQPFFRFMNCYTSHNWMAIAPIRKLCYYSINGFPSCSTGLGDPVIWALPKSYILQVPKWQLTRSSAIKSLRNDLCGALEPQDKPTGVGKVRSWLIHGYCNVHSILQKCPPVKYV